MMGRLPWSADLYKQITPLDRGVISKVLRQEVHQNNMNEETLHSLVEVNLNMLKVQCYLLEAGTKWLLKVHTGKTASHKKHWITNGFCSEKLYSVSYIFSWFYWTHKRYQNKWQVYIKPYSNVFFWWCNFLLRMSSFWMTWAKYLNVEGTKWYMIVLLNTNSIIAIYLQVCSCRHFVLQYLFLYSFSARLLRSGSIEVSTQTDTVFQTPDPKSGPKSANLNPWSLKCHKRQLAKMRMDNQDSNLKS